MSGCEKRFSFFKRTGYAENSISRSLFFRNATSIHINATSTQLSQTSNIHGFFDLLLSVHRCWCH
ncbi:hypothetical protein CLI86_10125 [Tannerella forsythia]|uniref:Uncharacterized protein n=1 Tax=Tannerella forsythia TaxID=28112 RepID=A0A2A6E6T6_TANFO|nr:hypothetical protein CLI86_10125 [Tannerella forsythia]